MRGDGRVLRNSTSGADGGKPESSAAGLDMKEVGRGDGSTQVERPIGGRWMEYCKRKRERDHGQVGRQSQITSFPTPRIRDVSHVGASPSFLDAATVVTINIGNSNSAESAAECATCCS